MAKRPNYIPTPPKDNPVEILIDSVARFALTISAGATLVCVAFLLYYAFAFASGGGGGANPQQAEQFIAYFMKALVPAAAVLGLTTAYIFWGEEVLAALQLIGAAILYFAPSYLPSMMGGQGSATTHAALRAIQMGGLTLGAIAVIVLMLDVAQRIRLRTQEGARADQLKYGKGIKEEKAVSNTLLGKCWQLPFCRKFVRDKCPIYHARRTCWKERVGCMCEESVIANAMAGKVIPRDIVAAAKFIPYNTKLPELAKAERCRQCVIYNEHQKHKYKVALPSIVVGLGIIYAIFREPLLNLSGSAIVSVDRMVGRATFRESTGAMRAATDPAALGVVREILLVCAMLVVMAYLLRLIEYLFFKAKV